MKLKEIKSEVKAIEQHIKKSKIIEKCIKVAETYGEGRTTVHAFHTHADYKFSDGKISIRYNDGVSEMGGGELYVDLINGKRVFELDRSDSNELYPKVGGFEVTTYLSGDWEEKINNLATKGPEKEKEQKKVNPLEQTVSKEVIADIHQRFRI